MKSVLVLYATREGQTAKVAMRIADHLRAAGLTPVVVDARDDLSTKNINPNDYDLLVFGASMHAGGLEGELVRFVNQHADCIEYTDWKQVQAYANRLAGLLKDDSSANREVQ